MNGNIFIISISVILFLTYIFVMAFCYIMPISRIKRKAYGNVLFPNEKKFKFAMVFVFLFFIFLIIYSSFETGIYQWITLSYLPALFMQRAVVVRSDKELFINGRTIQISDIEHISFNDYADTKYITITVRNQKPIKVCATKEIRRLLNDLAYGVQAGYWQDW